MNKDAININQNGFKGRVLKSSTTNTPIWTSTDQNDTTVKFLLLANISDAAATMSVDLSSIGISGTVPVKEVWSGTNLGNVTTNFSKSIPSHDVGLYIIGEQHTTSLNASILSKTSKAAGDRAQLTSSNRYTIPSEFAGKTVRVSTFGLSGKLLNSTVTRDQSILLNKNNAQGEKIGIVKITTNK
jgi:hypothetical protein